MRYGVYGIFKIKYKLSGYLSMNYNHKIMYFINNNKYYIKYKFNSEFINFFQYVGILIIIYNKFGKPVLRALFMLYSRVLKYFKQ